MGFPNPKEFDSMITDIDLEQAATRRSGGKSEKNLRNEFYYELMRIGPHRPSRDVRNV